MVSSRAYLELIYLYPQYLNASHRSQNAKFVEEINYGTDALIDKRLTLSHNVAVLSLSFIRF